MLGRLQPSRPRVQNPQNMGLPKCLKDETIAGLSDGVKAFPRNSGGTHKAPVLSNSTTSDLTQLFTFTTLTAMII